MGEEEWRVHNVGFPAIDLLAAKNYATPEEINDMFDLKNNQPIVIFTQHSIATEFELTSDQIIPSLKALDKLSIDGFKIIITYPNNDAGGKKIIEEIGKKVKLERKSKAAKALLKENQ